MNLLIFQNPYEFFQVFFYIFQNTVYEKKWGYNRTTVSSIIREILVRDMQSCYKNISKTRSATFIFQNFQNFFQHVKRMKKFKLIRKINKIIWKKNK